MSLMLLGPPPEVEKRMREPLPPAPFLLAQHVIGFGDVLELLLGFLGLVDVRMVFAGELAVRLLDVVVRSVLGDTKDFVEVFAEPFVFSHSCLLSRKVFM